MSRPGHSTAPSPPYKGGVAETEGPGSPKRDPEKPQDEKVILDKSEARPLESQKKSFEGMLTLRRRVVASLIKEKRDHASRRSHDGTIVILFVLSSAAFR